MAKAQHQQGDPVKETWAHVRVRQASVCMTVATAKPASARLTDAAWASAQVRQQSAQDNQQRKEPDFKQRAPFKGCLLFVTIVLMPTLQDVDSYPAPEMLIPRISNEHDYSLPYAEGALREAKRMLYLSIVAGEAVSPSELVDMAWHEMLMFTRFYQKFANFIGGFIHHDPTPGPPDGGTMYARTKKLYEKHFGVAPDPKFWP